MSDRPQRHSALDARDDLLAVAAAWPDLLARLGRETSRASDGMPKPVSRTPGLVINEHVSQTMAEIAQWVWFLARVLVDETDWQPHSRDAHTVLADIARTRVGHFTAHPDEMLRMSFYDDARRMRELAERVAYPDGYRTLDTRWPCESHGTSDAGERVPCTGTYTVRPRRDDAMPDLICSADRTHRLPPDVWRRASWRPQHEAGTRALIDTINRHSA